MGIDADCSFAREGWGSQFSRGGSSAAAEVGSLRSQRSGGEECCAIAGIVGEVLRKNGLRWLPPPHAGRDFGWNRTRERVACGRKSRGATGEDGSGAAPLGS